MRYSKKQQPLFKFFLCMIMIILCITLIFPLSINAEDDIQTSMSGDYVIDINDFTITSGAGWVYNNPVYTISDDVTVVGDNIKAFPSIFDIQGGHTVTWDARFISEPKTPTDIGIEVTGIGNFIIDGNYSIQIQDNGSTALKTGKNIALTLDNYASVMAYTPSKCTAIEAYGEVNIGGGCIVESSSDVDSTAIYSEGNIVIDGKVLGTTITGGMNGAFGTAIQSNSDININVNNGTITGLSDAIKAKNASVTVSGGSNIYTNSMLKYYDNVLHGNAITAKNVSISGNSKVTARNGAAVLYSNNLVLDDGAVFAYGDGIGGATIDFKGTEIPANSIIDCQLNVLFKTPNLDIKPDVIYKDTSNVLGSISENSVVLAWNVNEWLGKNEGNPLLYTRGDQTDLFALPENWTGYYWNPSGTGSMAYNRITYANGSTNGRFDIRTTRDLTPLKPTPKEDSNVSNPPPNLPGNTIPEGKPNDDNKPNDESKPVVGTEPILENKPIIENEPEPVGSSKQNNKQNTNGSTKASANQDSQSEGVSTSDAGVVVAAQNTTPPSVVASKNSKEKKDTIIGDNSVPLDAQASGDSGESSAKGSLARTIAIIVGFAMLLTLVGTLLYQLKKRQRIM